MKTPSSVSVFGIRLDLLDCERILGKMRAALDGGPPIAVTGPHFSILLQARRDPELAAFLNSCDINHPDGAGSALAVRLFGGGAFVRVNGTDLYAKILERFPPGPHRYFFLGGDEETVVRLKSALLARGFPQEACGFHHGAIETGNADTAGRIARFAPAILFVGMGSPKQFAWMERWRTVLNVPVIAAVGGGLEFLSGRRARAPRWMRVAGLEWVHRVSLEPRRLWKRYMLGIPVFLVLLLREKLSRARK